MRIRRFHQRARPFRFAGFWVLALSCLASAGAGRTSWQTAGAVTFAVVWPLLVERLHRRMAAPASAADAGPVRFQLWAYVGECAVVASVLGWASLAPLPALAVAVCLLAGATALAGWRLLLPAAAAAGAGAWLGLGWAPAMTAASTAAADAVAMTLILGFSLALGWLAFRQAQRLDAQRLALAQRSVELERVNRRMERYLPPSLRARLHQDPERPCRWERRWLTVVFVDLVGFTELSEVLDAEPLAGVLDEYLGAVVSAAEERGGEVSKLLGDGVMVVFGGREGGSRRCQVEAALTFCEAVPAVLAGLSARWRARGDLVELQMRAGVASGFCTLGDRGGAERLDFTLIGGPVNLSSRLQAHAAANGVLMDAASAALAEQSRRLGPPRTVELKGLGSLPAYPLP